MSILRIPKPSCRRERGFPNGNLSLPLPCCSGAIMNTIKGEQLLAQLNWRYATKQFDPTRKIFPDDWAALENALILSPSSYGLQPWRFVVISDQKMREKLFPSTWSQRQILDCSHFVVFAVRTAMTEADIDRHIARTAEVRGGTKEALKRFRDVMVGDVVSGPRAAQALDWAARQAYLALGTFMTSAALMGIDTCPMEGFNPDEYDKILNLTSKGLASVVCCAAGYRAAGDKSAGRKKVRFSREDVIHIV
jgi:nitroreductase